MSDDELSLSSDEERGVNAKKRKAPITKKTQQPAAKRKKVTNGRAKAKKRSRYDDSEDDFDDSGDYDEDEEVSMGSSDDGELDELVGMPDISSDEEEDSYDAELYKDDEDRMKMAAMTDIERQAILYERGERRNQIRERNLLKAQLRTSKGVKGSTTAKKVTRARAKPTRKPRAAVASTGEKKEALSALKAKRAETTNKSRRSKKSNDDVDSDYGEDESSEDEKPVKSAVTTKTPPTKTKSGSKLVDRHKSEYNEDAEEDMNDEEPQYNALGNRISTKGPANYQDILSVMCKRDELCKWLDAPHWEKTVRGVFVRASVGSSAEGRPVYRLAEIIDFNPDGKSYSLPTDPKRYVNMYLNLAIGSNEKEFSLEHVSNRSLEEDEHGEWERLVRRQGVSLPSKKHILKVAKQLHAARNYVRTVDDIEREIQRKQAELKEKGQTYLAPIYTTDGRSSLAKQLDRARDGGPSSLVAQLEHDLADYDHKLSQQAVRYRARDTANQQLLKINQRNRIVNTSVESTYVPETVEESSLNPFARRPTTTAIPTKKVESKSSATPSKSDTSLQKSGIASPSATLDLEMDALAPTTTATPVSKGINVGAGRPVGVPGVSPAKVLSFADYLSRRN